MSEPGIRSYHHSMLFFDIDETLIQNDAAERRAAEAFYLRHRELLQEPLDRFLGRWKALTEQNVRRYLADELSFQGQRRERIRQVFRGGRSLGDSEADTVFDFYLIKGGSTAAGLNGIWLNRGGLKRVDGIPTIGSLLELKGLVGDAIGC